MPTSADALRRWLGLFFLAVAFGMLIWGQTVLEEVLERNRVLFVIYWSFCFLLTVGAIVTALLDMRATRKRARHEHEQLLRRTMDDIDREAGRSEDSR
jgi:hypothetical protein